VISGPEKLSASVIDNFNGEYTISFKASVCGEYRISAYYKGSLVQGRAFVCLVVDEGEVSVGGGGGGGAGGAGVVKVTVEFDGRDQSGKSLSGAADKFTAKVKNPEGKMLNYTIKERESAKYVLTFDADRKGEYSVAILLGSYTVSQQVFNPFDSSSSSSSSGSGSGATSKSAGTGSSSRSAAPVQQSADEEGSVICEWSFAVQVLNAAGLPDVHDRSEFKVNVEGPDPSLQVQVKDKGNGKYKIVYSPKIHGDYSVHVTLRGHSIKGSPFKQTF